MLQGLILALICAITCSATPRIHIRAPCDRGRVLCAPEEAKTNETPSIGSDMVDILADVMSSVASTGKHNGDLNQVEGTLAERAPSGDLCCEVGASCLLLEKRLLPFCYDQSTTDFVLPGGAAGNINTGRYTTSDGDAVNLFSGSYILHNGTVGNIYAEADQPAISDTATSPVPTKFVTATLAVPTELVTATRPVPTEFVTATLPVETEFVAATPTRTNPEYKIRALTPEATPKPATTIEVPITFFVKFRDLFLSPYFNYPARPVQGTARP